MFCPALVRGEERIIRHALGVNIMTGGNDSGGTRVFFWFLWLCGVVIGCYFIWQIAVMGFGSGAKGSALPFFLGFFWLMAIQMLSLKRYQFLENSVTPLFIQLAGYVILCAGTAIKLTASA